MSRHPPYYILLLESTKDHHELIPLYNYIAVNECFAAFLLGYISIYFKNPIIRNLYPLSAGLSIVGFNGEGFVTDTTGAYSSSQSILLGVLIPLKRRFY